MKILTAHRIATGGIHEYPNLNRLEYRSKKFVDLDDLQEYLTRYELEYNFRDGNNSVDVNHIIYQIKNKLDEIAKDVNHSETMYEGKYDKKIKAIKTLSKREDYE